MKKRILKIFGLLTGSLLSVICSVEVSACGWTRPYSASRYPAFQFVNTPNRQNLNSSEVNSETIHFWSDYTGDKFDYGTVKDFIEHAQSDAIAMRRDTSAVMRYLVDRKDDAALKFLAESSRFNEALGRYFNNVWSYESPAQSDLPEIVDSIVIPRKSNPMYERYVFLAMRANAALHRYDNVIRLWNENHEGIKNNLLLDRMRGYLGGALYHTGKYDEAVAIFAENGDANSLNWCLAKLVGIPNLERLAETDPNSMAVQYVLQDFMNYLWALKLNKAQEFEFRFPGSPYRNSEVETDDDLVKECNALVVLADKQLRDKRLEYGMVWATAKAFAMQLMGKEELAKADADKAMHYKGTHEMEENLRRVKLWIDFVGCESCPENDNDLANRYNDLYRCAVAEAPLLPGNFNDGSDFYPYDPADIANYTFLADFLVPYMVLQYRDTSLYYRALAMMSGVKAINPEQGYPAFEPSNLYTDQLPAEAIAALVAKVGDNGDLVPIDRTIMSEAAIDLNPLYDALGRSCLAKAEYKEAIMWFDRINIYWISRQSYYPYLQNRSLEKTKSFEREQMQWENFLPDTKAVNYRAEYCRILQNLRNDYEQSQGEARAEAGYKYARVLFQFSSQGDLWAVSDNRWSIYHNYDSLVELADKILKESLLLAQNHDLQGKCLYAIASIRTPDGANTQASALKRLKALLPDITDPQIRGCRVLQL